MPIQKINNSFRLKPIILILFLIHVAISASSQWHIENLNTDNGLPQNSVSSLVPTNNQLIYFATMGGLVQYDGSSFILVNTPGSKRIIKIFLNAQGEIFFYNSDFELYHFKNNQFHLVNTNKYLLPLFKNRIAAHINTSDFYELIYLNRQWLYKTSDGFFSIEPPVLNLNSLYAKGTMVGDKFLKVTPNGFELIDRDCKTTSIIKPVNFKVDFVDLEKKAMFYPHGESCYFIYNNNFYHMYLSDNEIVVEAIIEQLPLGCEFVKTVYVPSKNNTIIYLGTENNGLFKFTKKQFKLLINKNPSYNIYYSQIEADTKKILTSNFNIFDLKQFNVKKVGNSDSQFSFLFKDSKSRIWSNRNDSLMQIDENLNIISRSRILSNKIFSSILEFREKFFISNFSSFYIYDSINENINSKHNLGSKFIIERMVPTRDTLIEIYTRQGMFLFNLNSKKIKKSKLPDFYYRNVFNTSHINDRIITTYGHGWFYNTRDTLIRLPEDHHEYLNTAHEILRDDHGMLWISTNNGLFLASEQDIFDFIQNKKEHIYFHRFTKKSGFNTNEFNGGPINCAIKLSDGIFSFSSMDGLVQFNPLTIKPYLPLPYLNVSEVKINNTNLYSPFTDSLILQPDYKSLELKLFSPHFDNIDNLYLYWKLDGYRDTWTKLDPDNLNILIPQLKTGKYTLQVKKLTGFGKDNHVIKEFKITVLPFWYQTSWGIALIISSVLFILYIINVLNTKRLSIQKQHLEKLIDDRNQQLIEINQDLKETINHNEMLMSVIVHDIKAPVNFINQITQGIKQKWDLLNHDEIKKMIYSVEESSAKITSFIHTFLTWTSAKKGKKKTLDHVNLSFLVDEIFDFHKLNDKITNRLILFDNQISDDLNVVINKQLLHIVLNNLIENSLKFTTKGSITIHYIKNVSEYIISCTDTGKGMTIEAIQTLMSEHYNPNSLRSDSFRLGYFFIKDILPIINGKMEITSEVGIGTTVNLIFSIDNNIVG